MSEHRAVLKYLLIIAIILGTATAVVVAQSSAPAGKPFGSPEAAVDAFVAAAENSDLDALTAILGPGGGDLVRTGEPVSDREILTEFAKLAREKRAITPDRRNRNLALLSVGPEDWPFPIPIVKRGTNWFFDTAAGRRELLYRRIGRNELDTIEICRGYVDAQQQYALTKHDDSRVNQYAQRIISTPGKHDGLAWKKPDGKWGGPIGEAVALELDKSYKEVRTPFHGYYFKILTKQGKAAPLGNLDYVQEGAMIGGFAILAYPSTYQVTGVKSFIVSQDGVVYEKDLGANTADVADKITSFDPDLTWKPVDQ